MRVMKCGLILCAAMASLAMAAGDLPMITVKGDRFIANGKEFKIWGYNEGNGLNLSEGQLKQQAEQVKFLGINMLRLHTIDWTLWGEGFNAAGQVMPSGLRPTGRDRANSRDLVNVDGFWRFMDAMRDSGVYVAVTLNVILDYVPGDSSIVTTTPEDEKAWREAVSKNIELQCTKVMPAFDERCLAINKEWATKLLTLKRPGTDHTLAKDSQLALLTLLNEASCWRVFFRDNTCLNDALPKYFYDKAIAKWNTWVKAKYGTDEKVAAAWKEEGKRGLLPGESVTNGTVLMLPRDPVVLTKEQAAEMSFEHFSAQRKRDYLDFLAEMDIAFYNEMLKTVRQAGWEREFQYEDMVGVSADVAPALFKAGALPFIEDHPYWDANIDLYNWSWIKLCQYYGANCGGPQLLDRPHWGSEIDAGWGPMRIPFVLFIAAYHSLQGRDGITWHVWTMNRNHMLMKDRMMRSGKECHMNWDPELMLMYRASGRLFKSCEIRPLPKNAPERDVFQTGEGNFKNDQVYRLAGDKVSMFRVETEHFRCVSVPRPEKVEFKDVTLDLTSNTYNTVVVEKMGDVYEITAVGRCGTLGVLFEPLEYVTGSVVFKNKSKQIATIEHIDAYGQVIETVPVHGGLSVPILPAIELYRVTLEPAAKK